MKPSDILKLRLSNTGLTTSPFKNVAEAVSHLGAVQAQDFSAAKWGIGLRIKNSTDEMIEMAFNEGAILRTHVMRPTWHFVLPENIRWMLDLTAARVKTLLGHYNRKLNLDDSLLTKSNDAIVRALQKQRYLTRQELKTVLEEIGIRTDAQRLAHIIVWAELDALICSGPRSGKQFTYALLDERVPKFKKVVREEALSKLALTYFVSHGPAQLTDFSWWSGLSMKDARNALDSIQPELEQIARDSKTYWFSPRVKMESSKLRSTFLLSIYDEYTIAYKDRSDLGEARDTERMLSMGNALTAVIILKGKVAGTWKKRSAKKRIEITLQPFRKLIRTQWQELRSEVARFEKFTGTPAVLVEVD
jgi:hypothetical protein